MIRLTSAAIAAEISTAEKHLAPLHQAFDRVLDAWHGDAMGASLGVGVGDRPEMSAATRAALWGTSTTHPKFADQTAAARTLGVPGTAGVRAPARIYNHTYHQVTRNGPRIAVYDPQAEVSTRSTDRALQDRAALLGVALRQWIEDEQVGLLTADLAADMHMYLGAVLVDTDPIAAPFGAARPDAAKRDREPRRPVLRYIEPRRVIYDTQAARPDDARWIGHQACLDPRELLARAQAENAQAAAAADGGTRPRDPRPTGGGGGGGGGGTANADAMAAEDSRPAPNVPWDLDAVRASVADAEADAGAASRTTIEVTELWVRTPSIADAEQYLGPRPGPEFNGAVVVYCRRTQRVLCRAWAFGPPTGRYVLFIAYPARRGSLPLSPSLVDLAHAEALQTADAALLRGVEHFRRVVMVSGEHTQLAQALRSADGGVVFMPPGTTGDEVFERSWGGVDPKLLDARQLIAAMLDDQAGSGAALRGNPSRGVTATADSIAASTDQARLEHVQRRFLAGVERMLTVVLWLMIYDPAVDVVGVAGAADGAAAAALEADTVGTGQTFGAAFDADEWAMLRLSVVPGSMGVNVGSPKVRQTIESMYLLIELAKAAQAFPALPVRAIAKRIGDMLGDPVFAEAFPPVSDAAAAPAGVASAPPATRLSDQQGGTGAGLGPGLEGWASGAAAGGQAVRTAGAL